MPIATTCPNCKAMFRLADELSGKTVKCQKCQQMFVVPEGSGETVAPGASVASPVEEAPPVVLAAASAPLPLPPPPVPPPVAARAEEETAIEERDHDEPPPLPNKRREPSLPRRRDEPVKSGSRAMPIVLAILGVSVLLCVVCAGAGVGFWALVPNKKPQPKRPIVIRDQFKNDVVVKVEDRKFEMPKIDDKFDGFKDGFLPAPPKNAAAIPVNLGADGAFRTDNKIAVEDPLRNNKRYKLYSVRLEAGKSYQIDMMSKAFDSYLFIYDDANIQVAADDDSGGDFNARIFFRPLRTATYRIEATTFLQQVTGDFSLTIRRN